MTVTAILLDCRYLETWTRGFHEAIAAISVPSWWENYLGVRPELGTVVENLSSATSQPRSEGQALLTSGPQFFHPHNRDNNIHLGGLRRGLEIMYIMWLTQCR